MSTVRMTSAGEFCAFRLNALFQTLVEEQHLRLDAGLGGEGVEHRLDQVGLAIGVDVDSAVRRTRPPDSEGRHREGCDGGIFPCVHVSLLAVEGQRCGTCFIPGSCSDWAERPLYLK